MSSALSSAAQQVTQLATNGRNVTALAALGMGVSNTLPAFSGVNALTSANGISFNGTRSTHNIYMLDGGELNDRGCGGCFSSLPSIDALAEFQTLDSNYSPDYGVGSGGTILMVLKSGTHDFHGVALLFQPQRRLRRQQLLHQDGRPAAARVSTERTRRSISADRSGFPTSTTTSRSRTFFFVNEEWRRLIQGSSPNTVNTIAANNFPTAGSRVGLHRPLWRGHPNSSRHHRSRQSSALYATDGLTIGTTIPGQYHPCQPDGSRTLSSN